MSVCVVVVVGVVALTRADAVSLHAGYRRPLLSPENAVNATTLIMLLHYKMNEFPLFLRAIIN